MYRSLVLAGLLLGSSCVSYVADSADAITVAAEVGERAGGTFTYRDAVQFAFRHNPELRRLTARARAANADLTPFALQSQYRNNSELVFVTVDPLALLDLGPRGAANTRLEREAAAAAVELVVGRWQIAAAIAEAFAIEEALADLPPVPAIDVDARAFSTAGLGADTQVERLLGAQRIAGAEASERAARTEQNRARLRELLALPPLADLALVLDDERGIGQPARTSSALLARPDLTLQTARFRVADAAFRAAVADQYPQLALGPDIPVSGNVLEWVASLRLPVGAWGRAEAAQQLRAAARAELEREVLRAMREAREAELARTAAEARSTAAHHAAEASAAWLRSAIVGLDVDPADDAFATAANAATMAMQEATMMRQAALAAAVARVREAVAYGWPTVVVDPREAPEDTP